MREYTFVVKRSRGRIEIEPVTRQTSAYDVIDKAVADFDVAVDAQFDVTVTLYWSWRGPDDQGATVAELDEVAERVSAYIKADEYVLIGRNAADMTVNEIRGTRQKAPYGLAGAEATARSMLTLKPELAYVEAYHRSEVGYPVRTIRRSDLAADA